VSVIFTYPSLSPAELVIALFLASLHCCGLWNAMPVSIGVLNIHRGRAARRQSPTNNMSGAMPTTFVGRYPLGNPRLNGGVTMFMEIGPQFDSPTEILRGDHGGDKVAGKGENFG
jgi:hypothetical protein